MSISETNKSPWGETKRKRGSQFPVKREAVLNAAAAMMRRHGYTDTSLAELAEVLNITKPTLYYYVGSKEELYAEIITRAQLEIVTAIRSIVETEGLSGFEKLRRILFSYAEYVVSDFGSCALLPKPQDIGQELVRHVRQRDREANTLVYTVLEAGRKDGSLKIEDATVTLHTIFGSLSWTPRWYKSDGRLSVRKCAEMQVRILLDGVRGPTAEAATMRPTSSRPRRKV